MRTASSSRSSKDKERAWAKLEAALRAAAGKLAMAALGQSPELDAAIDHVMAVLRTDPTALNLDSSVTGLMRALVRRLAEMPPISETAAALARRLEIGVPEGGWEPFLRSVADAVGGVVTALEGQRRELEDFLERVTQQLTEFEQWTHWRVGAAQSRRDGTLGLERTMQAEIVHLNQEVGASTDFSYLKTRVQARLDNVAQQLIEFRHKEERRQAEDEERTSELTAEV